MNRDATNVEDIDILQIKERLLLSCVAFFEDWSLIFRNRSFTLCKNDLGPNDKSDSVSSSTMTNYCAPRWRQTTGFPVLSWFSSSSKMTCLCSREKRDWNACAPLWGQTTGFPVLSSINSSDFHSWEEQALSSLSVLNSLMKSPRS